MSGARIVVLGGGMGGVVAVNVLRERLSAAAEITLVDKSPHHTFKATFLRLLTGECGRDDAVEPLAQFDDGPVSFKQATVTGIDVDGKLVETDEGKIPYDYLIVALGVQYDEPAIPGVSDAHHVYTADAAEAYREVLDNFQGGDLVFGVSSTPYICPAAPVEAAFLTDHFLRKRGLREDTEMRFFFPGAGPMKKAGDAVAEMAVQALEERDIGYYKDSRLAAVEDDPGVVRFEDGVRWEYDLLFATPPHRPPDVVAGSPLADETGWIPVNRYTMRTEDEVVYAAGDAAKVMIPTIGKPLPKAGVFARKQAEVAAHNVANRVLGVEERYRFDGVGRCFLASKYGMTGKAGLVEADFFAEPGPESDIKQPRASRMWHWRKLLYERSWHQTWFPGDGGGSA